MAEKPYPSPSNLTEQLLNLCWRLATEMRAVYNTVKTKISKDEADAAYLAIKGKAVSASSADTATKATQDASGNVITSTYAKKSEVPTVMTGASSSAAGKAGTVPAPAAGNQGKYLRGDGTWQTPPDTTYSTMKGASSSSAGSTGLVPTPSAGSQEKFLRGDGTWQAQVNADWNATSGYGVINNKPSIPTKLSDLQDDLSNTYLQRAGGSLTGAVTFASKVGNLVGDDCYFGDSNVAGAVCIQGNNGNTSLVFRKYNGAAWGTNTESEMSKLAWDGTNLNCSTAFTVKGSAVALASAIPTQTSQLTNDSNFTSLGNVTATVDANTGTPSVSVAITGSGNTKGLAFTFKNLKGATGASGASGVAYITQQGGSASSWYRKWSNGITECGGYAFVANSSGSYVTLATAMPNSNYAVVFAFNGATSKLKYIDGYYNSTTKFYIESDGYNDYSYNFSGTVRYYAIGHS